jgi:hypothetical protein
VAPSPTPARPLSEVEQHNLDVREKARTEMAAIYKKADVAYANRKVADGVIMIVYCIEDLDRPGRLKFGITDLVHKRVFAVDTMNPDWDPKVHWQFDLRGAPNALEKHLHDLLVERGATRLTHRVTGNLSEWFTNVTPAEGEQAAHDLWWAKAEENAA